MARIRFVSGIRLDDDDVHSVAADRGARLRIAARHDHRHMIGQRPSRRWRAIARIRRPLNTAGGTGRALSEALEARDSRAWGCRLVPPPLRTPERDGAGGALEVADDEGTAGCEAKDQHFAAGRRRRAASNVRYRRRDGEEPRGAVAMAAGDRVRDVAGTTGDDPRGAGTVTPVDRSREVGSVPGGALVGKGSRRAGEGLR